MNCFRLAVIKLTLLFNIYFCYDSLSSSTFFFLLLLCKANDLGYECLLLEDCCAATDPKNHDAAISMILKQGGVFGCVATSDAFLRAIQSQQQVSANES